MLVDTRAKKRRIWRVIGGMHKKRRGRFADTSREIPEDYIPRGNRRKIVMLALRLRRTRIVLHAEAELRAVNLLLYYDIPYEQVFKLVVS